MNIVHGKVETGLREGQYYITRGGYSSQFHEKLGFVPYPGTLNVRLDKPFIPSGEAIQIMEFSEEGKTFGRCQCYRIRINGIKAAIVRPERSSYPSNLIEIIAPIGLRGSLGISDGDEVEVMLD
ncbi:MAG: DUF120 domain-containing protein [Methanotrichaceae archaeon]